MTFLRSKEVKMNDISKTIEMTTVGTCFLYKEKSVIQRVRVSEIQNSGTAIYISLEDANTKELLCKETGEPRKWDLKKSLELGALIPDFDGPRCLSCNIYPPDEKDGLCSSCRREKLKEFFMEHVLFENKSFALDNEQLNAIGTKTNTLVTARAGSGKTRVLVAKLIDLFENKNLHEDEVLAFCFNRDASAEIKHRLNCECLIDGEPKYQKFDIAKTFHAFARQVVDSDNSLRILADDKLQDRFELIKKSINYLRKENTKYRKLLETFFLDSTLKIDRKKFTTIEHYYFYIRNSKYRTLNGEYVRSIAEKYIADFLFEHGIEYNYETPFYLKQIDLDKSNLTIEEKRECEEFIAVQKEIVPDFYLPKHNLVWEHWAVCGTENASQKKTFEKTVGSYEEYIRTKNFKQKFWNVLQKKFKYKETYKANISNIENLIETYGQDFNGNERESIESKLKMLLESSGVKCVRMPQTQLEEIVWERAKDYFTTQVAQFIDKYQQVFIDNEEGFIERVKSADVDETSRELAFWRLGYLTYKKYISVLESTQNEAEFAKFNSYDMDFNMCLKKAAENIKSGYCDRQIKRLKWVLIDEYQDFSKLFHDLILSMLERNPDIRVFCVGDNWQSINRFAGSDLSYFNEFDKNFSNTSLYNIRTNYRSEEQIVKYANSFMEQHQMQGQPSKPYQPSGNPVKIDNVERIFVDEDWRLKVRQQYDENNINEYKISRYLKIIADIVNEHKDEKIFILTRRKEFLGKQNSEIQKCIKNLCDDKAIDLEVKTVHKSKGEQADCVIIAEVNESNFPLIHPDNYMFSVFGETSMDVISDEMRLYYVAITRAKKDLFILYDESNKSSFLM